jgi:predicted metal-binding protein
MKIGIIICERYRDCAGGKCFKSMQNREGAFDIYPVEEPLEIAGYARCGGCPGGNIEYAPQEMIKNGAQAIHLATGFLVGYPPCPYLDFFQRFIEERYQIRVIPGTHPIPQKYYLMHQKLGTWNTLDWQNKIASVLPEEDLRKAYD